MPFVDMDESLEGLPDPDSQLLHSTRHGDLVAVKGLIDRWKAGDMTMNVNCKGECKNVTQDL